MSQYFLDSIRPAEEPDSTQGNQKKSKKNSGTSPSQVVAESDSVKMDSSQKETSKGRARPDEATLKKIETQLLERLNPEQKEAVLHKDGPLLILAGAGSGKTRVIIHRIARLIRLEDVAPWRILAVTFTNKAAREMNERLHKMVGPMSTDVWLSTFHSLGLRLLRYEAKHLDLHGNFTVYDSGDQETLLKRIIKAEGYDPKKFRPGMFAYHINTAKDRLLPPVDYRAHMEEAGDSKPLCDKVQRIYETYEAEKTKNRALDFADLIYRTVRLLRSNDEVRKKYQEKWRYIMVDEYQDTNYAQYELCRLLAGGHNNIAVVGDDDQSIYSWRGAEIRNILDFEKDYDGCRQIKLEQNYRSTKTILTAANSVIANNTGRKGKNLWTENPQGELVQLHLVYDEKDEARQVLKLIDKHRRDRKPLNDFAVFYRTNSQSRAFEEVLRKERIPYRIVGGLRFYERKEIKDLIAYLTILVNPDADVALNRIINFPPRGIGLTTVERLLNYTMVNGVGLFNAMENCDAIPKVPVAKISALCDNFETWREMVDEEANLGKISQSVLEGSGMLDYYDKDDSVEAKNRLANLEEFIASMNQYTKDHPKANLGDYLQDISLYTSETNPGGETAAPDEDAVTLMTFHNAKGLEFPIVFMTGMEEDIFPHYLSTEENDGDVEEERRLCYVGMTRAKNHLYLFSAVARWIHGQKRSAEPSRFLGEIDSVTVEQQNTAGFVSKSPHSPYIRRRDGGTYSELADDGWGSLDRAVEDSTTSVMGKRRPKSESNLDTHSSKTDSASAGTELRVDTYSKGDRIKHSSFGTGLVLAVNGKKPNERLVIQFSNGQVKQFVARFAPIQRA